MSSPRSITIGARGSQLSLIQTEIVKALLQPHIPDTVLEVVTIKTAGDKNMQPIPLDTVGKGWFTKEIDKQLLDGTIDMAVHSLKDILDTIAPGLMIAAIPKREDPREVLVSTRKYLFTDLPSGAVIGTDSIRRKVQIISLRPDLIVRSVRGNVNRRLEKLDTGEYSGLFLAAAGLHRLGLTDRISEYFDPTTFIPSPGQGALAIVCREEDSAMRAILSQLNDAKSVSEVTAERAFSAATGGGCSTPVGGYAYLHGDILTLTGMLGSVDGTHLIRDAITGTTDDPSRLGQTLAQRMLRRADGWYPKRDA